MSLTGPMVMGFLFSEDRTRVLLIRKTHPDWMAGKLNGIGGRVDVQGGEGNLRAMVREFREETGLTYDAWEYRGMIHGANGDGRWQVALYRGFGDVDAARSMTDEPVFVADVRGLGDDVLPNLRWIIPALLEDEIAHVVAGYR